MSYPTSIDTFTNPTPTQKLNSPSHSGIETAQNTALSALETKVGVTSSAVVTTIDYKLINPASINPGHLHTIAGISATGTPSANTFLRGDGAWASSTKFGGTGADGALLVTTGTFPIDLGAVPVFTKNYTAITISGGKLVFTNPHANGTLIVLKSQGNVSLTSAVVPLIDVSAMGSSGAAGGHSSQVAVISNGNTGIGAEGGRSGADTTGGTFGSPRVGVIAAMQIPIVVCGGGGGGGGSSTNSVAGGGGGGGASLINTGTVGSAGGANGTGESSYAAGGRGGGALYIECGGAYNFTGTISAAGANGVAGSINGIGGGGGGGGGGVVVRYITLTADSGTYTLTGGTGAAGQGNGGTGGNGGVGYSDRAVNTYA